MPDLSKFLSSTGCFSVLAAITVAKNTSVQAAGIETYTDTYVVNWEKVGQ